MYNIDRICRIILIRDRLYALLRIERESGKVKIYLLRRDQFHSTRQRIRRTGFKPIYTIADSEIGHLIYRPYKF